MSSESPESRIQRAAESLLNSEDGYEPTALIESAIRANMQASVDKLRHGSKILGQLIDNEELRIVGAEYSLKTAAVEYFKSPVY